MPSATNTHTHTIKHTHAHKGITNKGDICSFPSHLILLLVNLPERKRKCSWDFQVATPLALFFYFSCFSSSFLCAPTHLLLHFTPGLIQLLCSIDCGQCSLGSFAAISSDPTPKGRQAGGRESKRKKCCSFFFIFSFPISSFSSSFFRLLLRLPMMYTLD